MIFVTGDTHGVKDIHKLVVFSQENPQLTKQDYVIISGDFGAIWDKDSLDEELDIYSKFPWTTLFVDGNHENFDLINAYPVEMWHGGKVHKIREDVIHLMRGQVFEIEGKKIFTFGGGTSIDRMYRIEGLSWWRQELPTLDDVEEGERNLAKYNRKVDYVITHSCTERTLYQLPLVGGKRVAFFDNVFLSDFKTKIQYKHWYFGHYHVDFEAEENQTALFEKVVQLE